MKEKECTCKFTPWGTVLVSGKNSERGCKLHDPTMPDNTREGCCEKCHRYAEEYHDCRTCPCHTPPNKQPDAWQKNFKLKWQTTGRVEPLIEYIDQLLVSQRASDVRRFQEIKSTPAYIDLTTEWGQLDEDGVCIAVSRQALEETITAFDQAITLLTDNK